MRSILVQLTFAVLAVFCSPIPRNDDVYTDPLCPGNIKNLWLNVVVVVDKSQLMTNMQLWQVRNTITQVFGAGTTIGPTKYPADPRSTCVGVVTYDSSATVNAQLDTATSFNDLFNIVQTSLNSVDSTSTSSLSSGLIAASQVFQDGLRRTNRYNFRRVIIAFAANFQGSGPNNNVVAVADRLKTSGIALITVSCTNDTEASRQIANLASPGYSFADEMNTAKLVRQLTNALISLNCFCPFNWMQYRSDYHNETSTQYGICASGFKSTGGNWGYDHASEWCSNQVAKGHLANEFSQNKHLFLQSYMKDQFPRETSLEYYIGLRYLDNQWSWEQPAGQQRIPLNPDAYANWAPGYPQANSTNQVIANQLWANYSSDNYYWAPPQTFDWLFVCQVQASSTEYYTDYSYN